MAKSNVSAAQTVSFFFHPFHSLAFSLFCTADISQQVKVHFTQWSEGTPTPWGAAKTSTTPSGLAQPCCLSPSSRSIKETPPKDGTPVWDLTAVAEVPVCTANLQVPPPLSPTISQVLRSRNTKLPGYQNTEGIQGCVTQTCLRCWLRSVQLTEEQRQRVLSYICIFNLWLTPVFIASQTFKVSKGKKKPQSSSPRGEEQSTGYMMRKIMYFPVAEKYLTHLDYFSFSSKLMQMLLTISLLYWLAFTRKHFHPPNTLLSILKDPGSC